MCHFPLKLTGKRVQLTNKAKKIEDLRQTSNYSPSANKSIQLLHITSICFRLG
jgi:hypothetical protein